MTRYFNAVAVIFVIESIALVLFFISLLHGVSMYDIPLVTETGTYLLLLLYILIILSCTKIHLPQYLNLLESMKEDYDYICSTGKKYKTRYFENQLITWKICIPACVFTFSVAISMITSTIVALIYFGVSHTAEAQRPMLFPIWLPWTDVHQSPTFEIIFILTDICTVFYGYVYVFMLQTQIVWVRQIASKADVIIWSIQDLLIDIVPTGNAEKKKYFAYILRYRLRNIVIQHQSMYRLLDDYSIIYKKLLLSEQVICGPLACLTAYCTVLKLEEGEVHVIFMTLFIGNLGVYLIPSVLGTFLLTKLTSICDACWDIPFWNADPLIRPYMVLIMQRSLRPLPLQAPGFQEISIQTFSRKMASAYSCFNMLRQVNI